ncbi:efflux transporter outer membrane subunit [Paracoccus sp. (in: a-proteobacteria)]|uniref:efflux transporter outer membrane subunit n=1 Tax=Paracoccus sp. TaxID=267 RepID=UPI002AFFC8D5|nr:efflux transporter outer membrane subunit [Paracoccus sp. (in: a-proteobacteria)]
MNHSFRPLLLSATLAALVAGCATTPSADPAANLRAPATYGRGDAVANAPVQTIERNLTAPPADVRSDAWWQGFNDPRLNQLVERVLDSNTDMASAGLRLQRASAQAGIASANLWPQASGSANASSNRSIDSSDDWSRNHSASVSLGWELDLWGKLRGQRDIAHWEAQATAQDLQATVLSLIGQSCELYWQLGYLNQAIASGQANLERLERTATLVQSQFDVGAVSRLEVRQARQNIESQRATQAQLEQQRVEARNALTVLLDGQPWPLAGEPQNLDIAHSPNVAEGLPAELLARRPDLRAAELRLRQSLANIKVTATSYYPSLSLTGSVGSSSSSLSDVLSNPVASLGVGLSLPFLKFRQMQLNIDSADMSYQIAANDFRKTLHSALAEVDNALSARERLAAQAAAAQVSHEEAVEIARLYEVRYRAGATDLRTWLDAQQTRRNAELSLAQARRSQLVNAVTLYKALGGGA